MAGARIGGSNGATERRGATFDIAIICDNIANDYQYLLTLRTTLNSGTGNQTKKGLLVKTSSTSFLALSCVGSLISAPALAAETDAAQDAPGSRSDIVVTGTLATEVESPNRPRRSSIRRRRSR